MRAILKAINHLLAGEAWARQRLGAFAGQSVRIVFAQFSLPMTITGDGYFVDASEQMNDAGSLANPPTVTLTLPPDTPVRLVLDRESIAGALQISGAADLAECLGFVFKNLRWDVEHDVAGLVGDIAAHRLVAGGRRFLAWQGAQARNLAINFAEFLTAERPTLVRRSDLDRLFADIAAVASDAQRVEERIARLERLR